MQIPPFTHAMNFLNFLEASGVQPTPGTTGLDGHGWAKMTRWEEKSGRTKRFEFCLTTVALLEPGPTVKYQATTATAMITMMRTAVGVSRGFGREKEKWQWESELLRG